MSPFRIGFNVLLISALLHLPYPAAAQGKGDDALRDLHGDLLPPGAIARLGTTRLRHTQGWRLADAAFSPDGKVLASVGGDQRLRMWDTATGKELHSAAVSFSLSPLIAFSGDGKTVAVAAWRNLALFSVEGGEPRRFPEQSDFVNGLAIAPDGKLLAVYGYGKDVSLLSAATGKEVRRLKGHEKRLLGVAFSANGRILATTSEDLTCRVWNIDDGTQQARIDTNKIPARLLAVSPSGKALAWWDEAGTIHIRDAVSGKEIASFEAGASLDWNHNALTFTPDGGLQALYLSHRFFQWDPEKGLKSSDLAPASGKTAIGRLAPDGKTAALWDWDHGTTLHLFDLAANKERVIAGGHLKSVFAVASQPAGQLIASASTDGTIRLWDSSTSREIRRWKPDATWHPVAFTADGKALAFGAHDEKSFIQFVHADTGKQLVRLNTERTHQLALSANGKRLLSADFTRVEIWDLAERKLLRELADVPETRLPVLKPSSRGPWLSYTVRSLSLSPDGTRAAAAFVRTGSECSIYLWDTNTGKIAPGWPDPKRFRAPVAFTPDGKTLAAVQPRGERENDLVLWDLAREEIVKRFPIADASCGCVAFSKDGTLLALAGYYMRLVQVYEVASGKEIARFQPHEGPATLAFSDDGTRLITGSDDTTILIWDLKSKALVKK